MLYPVCKLIIENIPGKKQKNDATIAEAFSCLDIDSLKIQIETKEVST
jgi:hypothetical protein